MKSLYKYLFLIAFFTTNLTYAIETEYTIDQYEMLEIQHGRNPRLALQNANRLINEGEIFLLRSESEPYVVQEALLLKNNGHAPYSLEYIAEAWKTAHSWKLICEPDGNCQDGFFINLATKFFQSYMRGTQYRDPYIIQSYSLINEDGNPNHFKLFVIEGEDYSLLFSSEIANQQFLDPASQNFYEEVIKLLHDQKLDYQSALNLILSLTQNSD